MTGVEDQSRRQAPAPAQPPRYRSHRQSGFTLVEVMVVILVIGILLAVSIPTFLGARNRAHDVAARSSLAIAVNAARAMVLSDSSTDLTDADASRLSLAEPSLTFVPGNQASTGPMVVSLDASSADRWVATVQSRSGICFATEITPSSTDTYSSSSCSAGLASDANEPVNVAPVSGIAMTSDWRDPGYEAVNMVDGSLATFAHSDWVGGQSTSFDIGRTTTILDISLWNRPDCCQNRMANMWIVVSDSPISTDVNTARASGAASFYLSGIVGSPSTVAINAEGQHVRIFASGPVFHLAEIEIMALP